MGYKLAGYEMLGNVEIDPQMMALYKRNHKPRFPFQIPIQEFKTIPEFAPHGYEDEEDPEYWVADNGIAGLVHCSIPSDPRSMVYMNRVGKKGAGRILVGQEWNQFPNGGERDASRM
ncbi:hypothetical protein [Brevibacillus nitrificans]|uniref:hypothetical protein n=1 Tax=Brevibacillus nitrificans TaxID=651560 RepID=UPI00285E641E|nr:hypothetical protein [Brevibacillus nitrificans]MDR7316603.1 site-specific DNA-cytosine methylase [Brevibacillus nitrificans]